jgi:hypothetical protein
MRQTTLAHLEMTTRIMVVEARDTLSRINARFQGICRDEEERTQRMREAIRREDA